MSGEQKKLREDEERRAREFAAYEDAALQGLCEAGREEVVAGLSRTPEEEYPSTAKSREVSPHSIPCTTRDDIPDPARSNVPQAEASDGFVPLSPDSSLELRPRKAPE